jgi:hypothetical protein
MNMFEFINRIIKAANRYTFWDYFFLKTTVLVFGIGTILDFV